MTESRLRLLAGWLHGATLACQIALPLILGGVFVAFSMGLLLVPMPPSSEPDGIFLWLGAAAGLLPAVALFWALDILRRLFARYRAGDVLTEGSARLIRQAGKALLVLAALKIISQPLQTLLLTWQSPPGSRMVAVEIGQAEVGFVLVAGLLTLIGWAMSEAARATEENRAFV